MKWFKQEMGGGRIMDKNSTYRKVLEKRSRLIMLPKYFWPATGGLQISSARIANALADMGWQVSIYFPAEPNHQSLPKLTMPRLKTFAIHGERQDFWKNIPAVIDRISQDSPVLAVGLERESIDAQINALGILRQMGSPTFLRITTTKDIAYRINASHASGLARLDGIVVLNREMEKEAENCGLERDLIHRIPVMVNPNRYRPNEVNLRPGHKTTEILPDRPVVLYVGRLDPRKQIELLIKAMAGVDAVFRIVGDPTMGPDINETKRYLRLAREFGLGAIKIDPQIPETDAPATLRAANVFVTASQREGMSNAVLEAASVGLSIVGFAIPGIVEIAEAFNGRGFFIAHQDSGYIGLRQAIQAALKDPMANWRLSREKNLLTFSPQKIGAKWDALLCDKQG